MKIRKAKETDLVRILEIYNQAIDCGNCTADTEAVEFEEMLQWYNNHKNDKFPVYVITDNGNVIGWSSLSPYRNSRKALALNVEISYYIDFDYHSRGLGSLIMQFMINKAKELEFENLIAILLSRNEKSILLLQKFGFKEWGRMPGIAILKGGRSDHLYFGLKL